MWSLQVPHGIKSNRVREDGASSSRKRTRGVPNMPKAPPHPRGQTPHFSIRAMAMHRKKWYQTQDETKYFLDVLLMLIAWPVTSHPFIRDA